MEHELTHHGILGQKWGVRRTPQQLGHDTGKGLSRREKRKKAREMSDAELRERISRLNLERQYTDLEREVKSKSKGPFKKMIGEAVESLGRKILMSEVDRFVGKMFKDKDDKLREENEHFRLEKENKSLRKEEKEFDPQKYLKKDPESLSYDTAQQLASWYKNVNVIKNKGQNGGNGKKKNKNK